MNLESCVETSGFVFLLQFDTQRKGKIIIMEKSHKNIVCCCLLTLVAALFFLAACQTTKKPAESTDFSGSNTDNIQDESSGDSTGTSDSASETDSHLPPDSYAALTDYNIILSDTASEKLKGQVEEWAEKFKEKTGITLVVKSDWEGGPVKRTDKEIVFGNTNRCDEFSVSEDLTEGNFQLARRNNKIFCVGINESSTILGIKYMMTMYLDSENPNLKDICSGSSLFGLDDGNAVTGDAFSRYDITKKELDEYIASHEILNVTECNADNTGAVDATELLQYLHDSGKKIYYPNGNYLFNGETLCFDGGVEFETLDGVIIHNYISQNPIVNFDAFGNLVGLQQNHLEYKSGQENSKHGSLVSPPLSNVTYDTDVDFLPIFYNDFGLMRTLTGQYGWTGWFYWSWNHQDNMETLDSQGYDPQRHPLLGWYYGDDPVVLDWICYWLRQYGINQMIVLSTPNRDTWEDPFDVGHWQYQLFNHVKNFDAMEYVLEVASSAATQEEILNHWKEVIRYYRDYPHYYTQTVDGKKLAVVYNWQENVLCSSLGGSAEYAKFLKEVSDYARDLLDVDGILVMSRASSSFTASETDDLNKSNVYHYAAGYEPNCIENQASLKTYAEYVNNFNGDLANRNTVLAISTGMYSHSHPSNWTVRGNTPELFEKWASKAASYLRNKTELLPVVTIYNISEWAEGGPGLQPNMQDDFGYLEAIAHALGITPGVSD